MTIQSPDGIRIDGEDLFVYGFRLPDATAEGRPLPKFVAAGSHLLRGCAAKLELDCGMLFVTDARAWTAADGAPGRDAPTELTFADLFPANGGRVFAGWFTGTLHVLVGEQIGRDVWTPVYERELTLTFENGLLTGRREQSNLHRVAEFELRRKEMGLPPLPTKEEQLRRLAELEQEEARQREEER